MDTFGIWRTEHIDGGWIGAEYSYKGCPNLQDQPEKTQFARG